MNRHSTSWGALVFGALLCVAIDAHAQAAVNRSLREERRDDRKEHREDRKELHEDRKELKEDIKDGADRKEVRDDKREIAGDKKDLAGDRKDLRDDRHQMRKARRHELVEKWGDIVRRPAGQDELKTHARRVSRLTRARAVAEAEGKKALVERIDKIIAKENARHQTAMEKIKESSAPAPAATPTPVAPATPAATTTAGGKP